jgi:hypothetical protein
MSAELATELHDVVVYVALNAAALLDKQPG